MRINTEQATAQPEAFCKTIPLEVSAEVVLPDYRSEISRLLWVRPRFAPPTRFVGGGKADFSGACYLQALYVGPDGMLYSITHEHSYAFSVPIEGRGEEMELSAQIFPEAVISRVSGPRKLSVRCRMHARVRGYTNKSFAVPLPEEAGEEVRLLCEAMPGGLLRVGDGESLEFAEKIALPCEGEARVILATARLFLPEAVATGDGVCCRGEVVFECLCCAEDTPDAAPFTLKGRIPFERELLLEGGGPDCQARAFGCVCELNATPEAGSLLLEGRAMLMAEVQRTCELSLCRDVFWPGRRAECSFAEERLWQAGECENLHFSISGEVSPSGIGVPQGAELLLWEADAECKEKSSENGKLRLAGEVHCQMLYRCDGEYGTAQASLPFLLYREQAQDAELACCVPICRVSAERETWRLECEVQLALRSFISTPVRALQGVEFFPAQPIERQDVELCYPGSDETLWEVSKRYGVSPEALAAANGISAEGPGEPGSLGGVCFLLIP